MSNIVLKNNNWEKLTDLLGEPFVNGSSYYIVNNDEVPFYYMEADAEPDDEDRGAICKASQLIYKATAKDLFVRMADNHTTNIFVSKVG